jgi:beta-phosphoglucomutase-like phosphatase (HAD superfamily)
MPTNPLLALGAQRPQAVLFDLDGTLLDCELVYDECLLRAARAAGVPEAALPTAAHAHAMHGMTLDAEFDYVLALAAGSGVPGGAGAAPLPTRAALEECFWREFAAFDFAGAASAGLLPGVEAASAALAAAGVPQAIATMSTQREVDAKLRAPATARVHARMRAVVCWGMPEVARPKPAPDVYLEAARRLGVDAACCVVVEDTLRGVAAGAAAGAAVIAVPSTRPFDEAAFRAAGAALVLGSLEEADFASWLAKTRATTTLAAP